jgi:hypothetical protein
MTRVCAPARTGLKLPLTGNAKPCTSGWCRKYDYAVIAQYSFDLFERTGCRRRRFVVFQLPVSRCALVHSNGLRQLFLGQTRKDPS